MLLVPREFLRLCRLADFTIVCKSKSCGKRYEVLPARLGFLPSHLVFQQFWEILWAKLATLADFCDSTRQIWFCILGHLTWQWYSTIQQLKIFLPIYQAKGVISRAVQRAWLMETATHGQSCMGRCSSSGAHLDNGGLASSLGQILYTVFPKPLSSWTGDEFSFLARNMCWFLNNIL